MYSVSAIVCSHVQYIKYCVFACTVHHILCVRMYSTSTAELHVQCVSYVLCVHMYSVSAIACSYVCTVRQLLCVHMYSVSAIVCSHVQYITHHVFTCTNIMYCVHMYNAPAVVCSHVQYR